MFVYYYCYLWGGVCLYDPFSSRMVNLFIRNQFRKGFKIPNNSVEQETHPLTVLEVKKKTLENGEVRRGE